MTLVGVSATELRVRMDSSIFRMHMQCVIIAIQGTLVMFSHEEKASQPHEIDMARFMGLRTKALLRWLAPNPARTYSWLAAKASRRVQSEDRVNHLSGCLFRTNQGAFYDYPFQKTYIYA